MDFRDILYSVYVTKFKVSQTAVDSFQLKSYCAWAEAHYKPFLLGINVNCRILELGCGPGFFIQFLKKQGFKNVVGIDKSSEQVQLARKKGCEAYVADAFDFLKTNSNKFDVIIAIDLLEHFSRDELIRLIPLIFVRLANSGRLIIQTVNGQGIFTGHNIYGDLTHLTIFTPDSLRQLLNLAGFSDFVFSETSPVPKNILGLVRLILWRCISCMANFVKMVETGRSQKIWTENMICCCRKYPPFGAEQQ